MRNQMRIRRSVLGLGLLASAGALVGGVGAAEPEEVKITLSDYKIAASKTSFELGKPYRFVIANAGNKEHEWLIAPRGVDRPLIEVEEDELEPGMVARRDFTFKQAGAFEFSCHYRNHYRRGMKLPISVK
jgi:uncharacterized cupredoxin-like copper-binding protein